jgi:hypothetical protein
MDVSGRILGAWMPAIHAGMTEAADGQNGVGHWRWRGGMHRFFSCSAGERKLMTNFVVRPVIGLAPRPPDDYLFLNFLTDGIQ